MRTLSMNQFLSKNIAFNGSGLLQKLSHEEYGRLTVIEIQQHIRIRLSSTFTSIPFSVFYYIKKYYERNFTRQQTNVYSTLKTKGKLS